MGFSATDSAISENRYYSVFSIYHRHFSSCNSQKTPHSSHRRVCGGVRECKSDGNVIILVVVLCALSFHIWPWYSTQLPYTLWVKDGDVFTLTDLNGQALIDTLENLINYLSLSYVIWHIIVLPCTNIYGRLSKLQLSLNHSHQIAPHTCMWIYILRHALNLFMVNIMQKMPEF